MTEIDKINRQEPAAIAGIEGLRALSDAATPGPWGITDDEVGSFSGYLEPDEFREIGHCSGLYEDWSSNVAFIIAAVNLVRTALAAPAQPRVVSESDDVSQEDRDIVTALKMTANQLPIGFHQNAAFNALALIARLYRATPKPRAVAWMRGVTSPSTPHGPAEYDVDLIYGGDQPPGEGWIPLYREPRAVEAGSVGWQPIETAPKDGTWVLLAGPSGMGTTPLRVEVCRFYPAYRPHDPWQNHGNDAFRDGGSEPTHWMLLPPPVTQPPAGAYGEGV